MGEIPQAAWVVISIIGFFVGQYVVMAVLHHFGYSIRVLSSGKMKNTFVLGFAFTMLAAWLPVAVLWILGPRFVEATGYPHSFIAITATALTITLLYIACRRTEGAVEMVDEEELAAFKARAVARARREDEARRHDRQGQGAAALTEKLQKNTAEASQKPLPYFFIRAP